MLVGVILISGAFEQGAYGKNPALGVAYGILTALAVLGLPARAARRGPRASPAGRAAVRRDARRRRSGCVPIGLGDRRPRLDAVGWPAQGWLILLALSSQALGWLLISITLPRLPAA